MKQITKFYDFAQINSGGYFVENEEYGVGPYVIIEAPDAASAYERLEQIGEHVSGMFSYCGCCGERWSNWKDDDDGTETPTIYGKPLEQATKGIFSQRDTTFIHYLDGSFKRFDIEN